MSRMSSQPETVMSHINQLNVRALRVGSFAAIVAAACLVSSAAAENWPAWRGPGGMGVARDDSVPIQWSDKQNLQWRVPLPDRGNSTPIIWGDRIFLTQATERDNRRSLLCFARKDGKLLWEAGVEYSQAETTNGQNPHCSSSPVTDGQRVIALFGSAGIYCNDLNGKELWHRDLGKIDSWHGSGSSPIIYEDLCIVNFGPGSNAALVALSKATGELVWQKKAPKAGFNPGLLFSLLGGKQASAGNAPATEPATRRTADFAGAGMAGDMSGAGGFLGSWSTPLLLHVADHDELILSEVSRVTSYDPKSGKELWRFTGLPEQVMTTPIAGDGVLIVTDKIFAGGTQVTAIKLGGSGDVTATHKLWQTRLPKECVGSGVVFQGRAYFITDFGTVVCLDVASGKKLAEKRLSGAASRSGSWSSIVLIDGKLLIPNQSGEVFVLTASDNLRTLGINSLGEETTCASLAISDGRVFLRTYDALWCWGKN